MQYTVYAAHLISLERAVLQRAGLILHKQLRTVPAMVVYALDAGLNLLMRTRNPKRPAQGRTRINQNRNDGEMY